MAQISLPSRSTTKQAWHRRSKDWAPSWLLAQIRCKAQLQMLQVSVQMETRMIHLGRQGSQPGFYFYCGGCQDEGEVKLWPRRYFIAQTLRVTNNQPNWHPHPMTIQIHLHVWRNQGTTKVSIKLKLSNSHIKAPLLSAAPACPLNLILKKQE